MIVHLIEVKRLLYNNKELYTILRCGTECGTYIGLVTFVTEPLACHPLELWPSNKVWGLGDSQLGKFVQRGTDCNKR